MMSIRDKSFRKKGDFMLLMEMIGGPLHKGSKAILFIWLVQMRKIPCMYTRLNLLLADHIMVYALFAGFVNFG